MRDTYGAPSFRAGGPHWNIQCHHFVPRGKKVMVYGDIFNAVTY